jgi:uncharacterized protein YbdZ (MbtH family)
VLLYGCSAKVKEPQDVEDVCVDSDVPGGWAVTRYLDTNTCQASSPQLQFNAVEIQRLSDKSIGTVMEICAWGSRDVPSGWVIVAEKSDAKCSWSKERPDLGHVKTIKRFE